MLSGKQSLYAIAAQVLIASLTILSATVLGYTGKIEGEAITALFGMAIGLAGGTVAVATSAAGHSPTATPTRITTPQGVTVETNGMLGAEHPPEGS